MKILHLRIAPIWGARPSRLHLSASRREACSSAPSVPILFPIPCPKARRRRIVLHSKLPPRCGEIRRCFRPPCASYQQIPTQRLAPTTSRLSSTHWNTLNFFPRQTTPDFRVWRISRCHPADVPPSRQDFAALLIRNPQSAIHLYVFDFPLSKPIPCGDSPLPQASRPAQTCALLLPGEKAGMRAGTQNSQLLRNPLISRFPESHSPAVARPPRQPASRRSDVRRPLFHKLVEERVGRGGSHSHSQVLDFPLSKTIPCGDSPLPQASRLAQTCALLLPGGEGRDEGAHSKLTIHKLSTSS